VSFPEGIAISGNNLYVPSQRNGSFGNINEYNATTGAAISVPLISGLLHAPEGLAISGNILGSRPGEIWV
jgi:DNA-binding beta-propeller fold protein YncE